ncbi:MAG: hypothetical protein QG608_2718 [Actinomycetota bacterium]|nr:hypothetical protein [Actinomycetota bacterium]
MDRKAIVRRHAVVLTGLNPRFPVQVGNGQICMSVDVTGLQSLPDRYPLPDPDGGRPGTLLSTQAQWGWHSCPGPAPADLLAVDPFPPPDNGAPRNGEEGPVLWHWYRTRQRMVPYLDAPALCTQDESALDPLVRTLRTDPHRLDLVRIGLVHLDRHGHPDGCRPVNAAEVTRTRQELDLWTGIVESRNMITGTPVRVRTACHPDRDAFAVRIEQNAPDSENGFAVRLAFPYGSRSWNNAADWTSPHRHRTLLAPCPDGVEIRRLFDHDADPLYHLRLWFGPSVRLERLGTHQLLLRTSSAVLDLVVELFPPSGEGQPDEPAAPAPLTVDGVLNASAASWESFWTSGAACDLSDSTDHRAPEVERRAVLSQYLTAIQGSGSQPPQETGLLCNSWRGRFHLEMHWWHAAHFPLWGRAELLERSMGWYERILPAARRTAAVQGLDGVRWPKQVGPDGSESPSHIGPFLVWQQPHPIYLAELLRRAAGPDRHNAVLRRYAHLVDQTARCMVDLCEPSPDGYGLGPPLVPAQESYAPFREEASNPPFEMAYWAWALAVAQQWRRTLGLPDEPQWEKIRRGMAPSPVSRGRYRAVATPDLDLRRDHPSPVYGLGLVPATGYLDPGLALATLRDIVEDWDWESTWGWDCPALAMTAARLGQRSLAVDLLTKPTPKNRYGITGHNRQSETLPAYLPGNGALLAALALLIGGWDGDGGTDCPGLPDDGTWRVRHEGFCRSP